MQRHEVKVEPLTLTINLNVTGAGDSNDAFRAQVLGLLNQILVKETKLMAISEEMQALVTELNEETNDTATKVQAVSDRIDRLIAGMPAGGLSAEQAAQVKAQLTQIRDAQQPIQDRLLVLGQDPTNPIP